MNAVSYGWLSAAIFILSACGDGDKLPQTTLPSTTVTPSISAAAVQQVKVGDTANVAVIFRAPQGLAASQLAITTGLSPLPPGWSSTASSFGCDTVSDNDDCRLDLRYRPALAGVSGTLNLGYRYIDANGVAQRGTADVPYGTSAPNGVTATVSPAGPLQIGVGTSALVTFTFRSNDGVPATALSLQADSLPAGWSVSGGSLSCASVAGDGNCNILLKFQPIGPVGASVLSLPYRFKDSGGTVRDGAASVTYSAIEGGAVSATVSPTGFVDTYVGSTASVQVDFTATDDVTGMQLISALPPEWTVSSGSLPCPTLAAGATCHATLTYAPANALASGTVPIDFTYTDRFGVSRSASVAIPYRARNHFVYVPNRSAANVTRCALDVNGDPASCVNLTPTPLIYPVRIALEGSSAYVVDATARKVIHCAADADGDLTNCFDTGVQMPNYPSGIAIRNGMVYITDESSGAVQRCAADADGSLSGCSIMTPAASALASSIAFDGDTMYVGNAASSNLTRCTLLPDGTPTACTTEPVAGMTGTSSVAISGTYLYLTNNGNNSVLRCSINSDSSLSGCVNAGATGLNGPFGLALFGGYAYLSNLNSNALSRCTLDSASLLTNCTVYSQPALNQPGVLAIR
ncbi:hypothetical protein [Cupriavidus plantarum]|uniref:hypothetical protein n=1 Tax=Cupriavidus plantarum TaxID=942865 RepID=UPI00339D6BA6